MRDYATVYAPIQKRSVVEFVADFLLPFANPFISDLNRIKNSLLRTINNWQ